MGRRKESERGWTFLTNHARVLACIVDEPAIRLRDVAARVGITERAAQRIVADLADADYVERERVGRRNVYRADLARPLRHPLEASHTVGALLTSISDERPLRAAQ
ncbi:MAG: helix-turn-helix transcriptional regulator [Actinomycetota bacterium]